MVRLLGFPSCVVGSRAWASGSFNVWGSIFRVEGLGLGVQDWGFAAWSLGSGLRGAGLGDRGLGHRVRVLGLGSEADAASPRG